MIGLRALAQPGFEVTYCFFVGNSVQLNFFSYPEPGLNEIIVPLPRASGSVSW